VNDNQRPMSAASSVSLIDKLRFRPQCRRRHFSHAENKKAWADTPIGDGLLAASKRAWLCRLFQV